MKIKAKAKINLTLKIVGQKDGYHLLESVVTEIDLYDTVTLKKSADISVKYKNCSFSIPQERDNAYKALKLFKEAFGVGAEVVVQKRIPEKAGLGGSSADAVGVIKGLQKLYKISDQEKIEEILCACGSDCPVQYVGGYALMRGRGEIVEKISANKKLHFALAISSDGVDTKKCFALYDDNPTFLPPEDNILDYLSGKSENVNLYNALSMPACKLNKDVQRAFTKLNEFSGNVNLSGSGSAVYALFGSKKDAKKVVKQLQGQFDIVLYTHN